VGKRILARKNGGEGVRRAKELLYETKYLDKQKSSTYAERVKEKITLKKH